MCTLVALLSVSCGKQHNVESVVEDFMEANISDASSLSDIEFNDIDSTRYLNDSIVNAMRSAVKTAATQYRHDIVYPSGGVGDCLVMVRVAYKLGEKRYNDTFYLNTQLTDVVAFKSTELLDD